MSPPDRKWRRLLLVCRTRWRNSFRYVRFCILGIFVLLMSVHVVINFCSCFHVLGLPPATFQWDVHGQLEWPEESNEWDQLAGKATRTHFHWNCWSHRNKWNNFFFKSILFCAPQSFETWMQFWLIFQMAQEKPAIPTAKPSYYDFFLIWCSDADVRFFQ